jgi:hypothetical protein
MFLGLETVVAICNSVVQNTCKHTAAIKQFYLRKHRFASRNIPEPLRILRRCQAPVLHGSVILITDGSMSCKSPPRQTSCHIFPCWTLLGISFSCGLGLQVHLMDRDDHLVWRRRSLEGEDNAMAANEDRMMYSNYHTAIQTSQAIALFATNMRVYRLTLLCFSRVQKPTQRLLSIPVSSPPCQPSSDPPQRLQCKQAYIQTSANSSPCIPSAPPSHFQASHHHRYSARPMQRPDNSPCPDLSRIAQQC